MNANIARAIELVGKFNALQQEIVKFLDEVNPQGGRYHPLGTAELRLWIADQIISEPPASP